MKKTKIFAAIGGLGLAALSVFLIAADHIDAPLVEGTSTDITDFYAFQGENPANLVFVINTQGLLVPGLPEENTVFDEDVLLEINIDNNNDLLEDLVIQAIKRDSTMYFFGPFAPAPALPGEELESVIDDTTMTGSVEISKAGELLTTTNNGMQFFAGLRDDPFFFDFNRYNEILVELGNGTTSGFNNPGTDTFADTNVLSVIVEVPKSMLGSGVVGANPLAPTVPVYNVWVEAKRK